MKKQNKQTYQIFKKSLKDFLLKNKTLDKTYLVMRKDSVSNFGPDSYQLSHK